MNTSGARTVIVGGGVPGIMAAMLWRRRGHEVTLIEKAPAVGGLYRSEVHDGLHFDQGTRFLVATGIPEVDALLGAEGTPLLRRFEGSLPEAHFLDGRLHRESGCPSLRQLPLLVRLRVLRRMARPPHSIQTAADLVDRHMGRPVRDAFYGPAFQKLAGRPLESLAATCVEALHVPRIAIFGPTMSKFFKRIPRIDRHLAHPELARAPQSQVAKWYPHRGGMGAWIDWLADAAQRSGVAFRLGAGITSIDPNAMTLRIDEGRTLAFDRLIWTLPASALLRLTGRSARPPPKARDVVLFHVAMDEPSPLSNHWVTDYDPQHIVYRVAIYDNFSERQASYRLTVECLLGPGEPDPSSDRILTELHKMGVVTEHAGARVVASKRLPRGIPMPSPEDLANAADNVQQARAPHIIHVGPDVGGVGGLGTRLRLLAQNL